MPSATASGGACCTRKRRSNDRPPLPRRRCRAGSRQPHPRRDGGARAGSDRYGDAARGADGARAAELGLYEGARSRRAAPLPRRRPAADLCRRQPLLQGRLPRLHGRLPARQLRHRAGLRGARDRPDRRHSGLPRHLSRHAALQSRQDRQGAGHQHLCPPRRKMDRRPLPGDAEQMTPPLLSLRGITKRFVQRVDLAGKIANAFGASMRESVVQAVSDVDLDVAEGEVVGLVGESGCGKSTLGRIVAGIMPQSAGTMTWRGRDVAAMGAGDKHAWQLAVQMIFQDPFASLNPRLRVSEIVGEAPRVHGLIDRGQQAAYVAETLTKFGLDPAYASRYPHQFSGGQRQRVGIARALAVKPAFIVCDEAVAALDVSIQAQVLNLFMDLRQELGLTYLFISHNLAVVEHLSDRVAIMYLGRLVEIAPADELFARPNHPYTQALLAEVPKLEANQRTYKPIAGELPSPLDPPPGCAFHPRCPHAFARCKVERPAIKEVAPGHVSACHLNDR